MTQPRKLPHGSDSGGGCNSPSLGTHVGEFSDLSGRAAVPGQAGADVAVLATVADEGLAEPGASRW